MFPAAAFAADNTEEPLPETIYASETQPGEENPPVANDKLLGGNPVDRVIMATASFLVKHPLLAIPFIPAALLNELEAAVEYVFDVIIDFFENPGDYTLFLVFE